MPNQTAGYFSLRTNPGDDATTQLMKRELNFILRQIQDRLDALGGNRGQHLHESEINLNVHKLVNVVDPEVDQDGATKNYVDEQFAIRGL